MGWEEWVRFVAAPTVLALLAVWIATRNSRKTPHERLNNLVDIEKNMPEGADPNSIGIGAIARELVDFDRRIKADSTQPVYTDMPAAVSASACRSSRRVFSAEFRFRPAMFFSVLSAQFTGNKTLERPGPVHRGHAIGAGAP